MVDQGNRQAAIDMRITEGYLSQHFQGRSGGRDPALLDGAEIDGFGFALQNRGGNRRADLVVDTPFGRRGLGAKIDLSTRGLWLPPVTVRHSPTRSAPDS